MRSTQTFIASASPTIGASPAGGTGVIANPTTAASPAAVPAGTALLVQNNGNFIAGIKFAATTLFAPAPMAGLQDYTLSPGAQLLVQNVNQLAAAFVLVDGAVSLTPGTISISLNLNY